MNPRTMVPIGVALFGLGIALGAVLFTGGVSPEENATEGTRYTCSMHPQIDSAGPGTCPICGMELIPKGESAQMSAAGDDHIVLSERARARARLRTTEVRRQGDESATVRLLGRVEPDEQTLKVVTAWTGGRIDRLRVNTTGVRVRRGEVIANLYSPEIYATAQDLIVAARQSESAVSRATVEAARDRLRLLGMPPSELDALERRSEPPLSVPIRTPYAGTVLERLATEGTYVETGAPLYRIADLSTVWAQLEVYENDLGQVAIGDRVTITVNALPGEDFEGRVTFIDPRVNPNTRTAQARVELENPSGRLRPGMFAEAVVQHERERDGAAPLVVPESAPLFTGRRALVYVERQQSGTPVYRPRTVRLGPKMGSVYPVVAGLSEGERVVTRGAFALDADLQIRGGESMMTPVDEVSDAPLRVEMSEAKREALRPVLEHYLQLQEALAADSHPNAQAAAAELRLAVADPDEELLRAIEEAASTLESSGTLEGARTGFEELSKAMANVLRRYGNPLDQPVRLAHCPMAFGDQGAAWIQRGDAIDNPYFGATMRTCGSILETVSPGEHLEASRNTPMGAHGHQGHDH